MNGTIGEMRIVAYDWAPRTWAFCNGQTESISSNTALFSIIGTYYGGDGRTTFKLPDLRGRVPLQEGQGPGLPDYNLGATVGAEDVTITNQTMGSHVHTIDHSQLSGQGNYASLSTGTGNVDDPTGAHMALSPVNMYASTADNAMGASDVTIGGSMTMGMTGGNQSHENVQPFLAMHYVICLQGVYPSRN